MLQSQKWWRQAMGALAISAAGLLSVANAGDADKKEAEKVYGASISPLKKAPTLDGKIEPGEWDNATGTLNFQTFIWGKIEAGFNGMHMDPRKGRTLVGYYDGKLYIAIESALPPRAFYGGGKHSKELGRDAELIGDFNAVEIWLDPNRDRRDSGQGDQAFYQIFVNSVGSLYDAKLVPGTSPDKGWNADIQTSNYIDGKNKIWVTEIAIPLKDLGWTEKDITGRTMGMLISRNYKAPWNQAVAFPFTRGAFLSWQGYPRFTFAKDEPVVRIESLGEKFWDAEPEFRIKIDNPGPARTVRANMHIKSSDMPDLKDSKEIALPANGSAVYTYKPGGATLHKSADHLFNFDVTSLDGKKNWFEYVGMWSHDTRSFKGSGAATRTCRWSEVRPIEQQWDIRSEASPANALGVAVYPSYNIINVKTDASMLVADPDGANKDKLSSSTVITITRDGKEVEKADLTWDTTKNKFTASKIFKLGDLPAGEYEISAKFDKHNEPIVKKYTREVYPWEGNTIGITDKIYPPFTAVKATAQSTDVVGREYGVGQLGLWSSITSLGKEILAAPIVLKADGDRVLQGAAQLVKSEPMKAVYEAKSEDAAVTVKTTCTTEIDGCMKLELQLLPGKDKQELKSLTLDIPLKDEIAPLWHASTTALRVNPCGETPKGEGLVWDSSNFPNGDWVGAFIPYIWLGGVERGLCVFGNNDKGWVLNWNQKKEFTPCQEIIRENGVLTLRLNLVQKPIILDEPRTIVLGLQASPTKPIPYKDWRAISAWHSVKFGEGYEWMKIHGFDMGMAVETTFNAAYPYNRDYSIYDAIMNIPGTPGGDLSREKGYAAFLKDWKARNGLDKPAEELTDAQKYAISRARRPVSGKNGGPTGYFGAYWDEYHNDYHGHPEVAVFNGEWGGNNMARSRQDFRCYYGAETVKRGIGLYFDNAFPHASRDLITSDAYEIPGMGIQPSANIWQQRDYHRRIWNIHREFGARWNNLPMSMIHMTNTNILPMLTWNDMNVDLEWFYGPEPQQSKYGLPLLQAETAARQSGCIPFALALIEKCKNANEQRIAERTKFGAMFVHDIRMSFSGVPEAVKLAKILFGFGYGMTGAVTDGTANETTYNYWQDDFPVTCDKPLVKPLVVKRNGELMFLICSWDKDPTVATFTLDTKALGVSLTTAEDAEGTPEQQAAYYTDKIAAAEKGVEKSRKDLEVITQQFEAGKVTEQRFKVAQAVFAHSEKQLKDARELPEHVAKDAALPVSYDAAQSQLSVNLPSYGVRIIKLK